MAASQAAHGSSILLTRSLRDPCSGGGFVVSGLRPFEAGGPVVHKWCTASSSGASPPPAELNVPPPARSPETHVRPSGQVASLIHMVERRLSLMVRIPTTPELAMHVANEGTLSCGLVAPHGGTSAPGWSPLLMLAGSGSTPGASDGSHATSLPRPQHPSKDSTLKRPSTHQPSCSS